MHSCMFKGARGGCTFALDPGMLGVHGPLSMFGEPTVTCALFWDLEKFYIEKKKVNLGI